MTKNDKYILTAESVTEGHPDKLCDTIADSVLDACLKNDPNARVACEVLATSGKILVAGEISVNELPDIPHIVCKSMREAGYGGDYEVEVITHDQSPDIAWAVDGGSEVGAGDQGVVYGFACRETLELLPLPVVLAHRITMGLTKARKCGAIPGLRPDGKAQVSVEYENGQPKRVAAVVVSCQHEEDVELEYLREAVQSIVLKSSFWDFPLDGDTQILINPGGDFILGGFEADTGHWAPLEPSKAVPAGEEEQGSERSFCPSAETKMSGLCDDEMVDTYGGFVPHGGGALSGKDGTKVDRSGAYMARYIAKNIVAARLAEECTVILAYAIGVAEPVMVQVDTHGTGQYPDSVLEKAIGIVFDLTPTGMIMTLRLTEPVFAQFCNYGHFMHRDAPWEQTDCVDLMLEASDLAADNMLCNY